MYIKVWNVERLHKVLKVHEFDDILAKWHEVLEENADKKDENDMSDKKVIPVFFASDDNYVPFLAVSIKSLLDNASKDYFYNIHILTDGLSQESMDELEKHMSPNSKLIFDDISKHVARIKERLDATLRDYYTPSIFYRLFIAALYPNYKKAIYLDCDIAVVGDISKMYEIELGDNIFGVVSDDVIAGVPEFRKYAEEGLGIKYDRYFNSGVLLMNLDKYREERIKEKFVYYLVKYNFETAAPDQDYLNCLCKDKVMYLEKGWDRMSTDKDYDGELYIIHYNNFRKPWYYDDVPYEEYFWEYAKKTTYYDQILKMKENFTPEMAEKKEKGAQQLVEQTIRVVNSDKNFRSVFGGIKE